MTREELRQRSLAHIEAAEVKQSIIGKWYDGIGTGNIADFRGDKLPVKPSTPEQATMYTPEEHLTLALAYANLALADS